MNSYWIEHDEAGRVLLASAGTTGPVPLMGGTIAQVDHMADPSQCLFIEAELIDCGPQPSPAHRLEPAAGGWVVDTEAAWSVVREERDRLLAETDWVSLRAQEQGAPVPAEWLAYRQALRDITLQPDPGAIVWPVLPAVP